MEFVNKHVLSQVDMCVNCGLRTAYHGLNRIQNFLLFILFTLKRLFMGSIFENSGSIPEFVAYRFAKSDNIKI